ncbi:glutathione S-transferase family protein [Algihabitans albus]|uniref:glutathione S-transferase family protein n=1 Tax=Algihabitans albus TaxID=2164067 RepID=UPI000E5D8F85|nr:glutathione S-transferase family protein [Algihabitans albus]
MSGELVLYTHPNSRGRVARWMLEEVAAPYRAEFLDYGAEMKSKSYLAVNPMGKVPALRHGEAVITETAAICAYLADAFPEAGLAPPVDARAAYYRWLFFGAGPMEAAIVNTALQFEPPEDKRGMVGYGSFATVLDVLQSEVSARPYLAGDRFSAADVSVGSLLFWSMQFGLVEKRPAFVGYWARISERPAYLRAAGIDDAALEAKAD